ncbi:o-succinylbenzoate synthase [Horticoccus luteus]|uniref:o-succinylbenzoate synthase n=1 Tax=Horticoccus luteus TaxID=2862869 RepID=A0A8F9TYL1_9BACT|nr:o-succinylbenzoate synthase [Horticoccus luteus]QYM80239.1 o-succinylbenzoate synthase [Horticoccus luteus]
MDTKKHECERGESYRLAWRRYRLPMRVSVRTAHGVWAEREGVIVRLEDDAGNVGYGEAAPIPWFGTETVEDIEAGCAALGERVTRETLGALPVRLGCLRGALAAARAADADGMKHDYLRVAALLPAGEAARAVLVEQAEAGFRVFKWKVGVADARAEMGQLDELCGEMPEGARLRLDANGAWDRRTAERWLALCAERPVEFVEQPCFAAAGEGETAQRRAEDALRGLAEDYPTPIALDESLVGAGDVARWLGAGWRGVFVVKPSLLGEVRKALDALSAAKASVVFSSALETAVGARMALECAFRWEGEARALGFGVWPLFADRRFDGPPAAPFMRAEDVARLNPETIWNALS